MMYFILGILFISVFSPILDSLVNYVVQAIQVYSIKNTLKIYKFKQEITKIAEKLKEEDEQTEEKHYGFYSLPEPSSLTIEEQEEESDNE